MANEKGRVTGLGGVFFKAQDKASAHAWYKEHLGVDAGDYGAVFLWREDKKTDEVGYTVFSAFEKDTKYFDPSESPFMINFRVENLDALLAQLKEAGIKIVGEPKSEDNGRFAWIVDPEGRKIELWEPVPSKDDPYL